GPPGSADLSPPPRRPSLGTRVASSRVQLVLFSIRSFLMSVLSFVSKLFGGCSRRTGTSAWNRARSRFAVEALEDRRLMSHSGMPHHMPVNSAAHGTPHVVQRAVPNQFQQANLVSDQMGVAQVFDANLVNPWGISESPNGGAFWLSDSGTGLSPLYLG